MIAGLRCSRENLPQSGKNGGLKKASLIGFYYLRCEEVKMCLRRSFKFLHTQTAIGKIHFAKLSKSCLMSEGLKCYIFTTNSTRDSKRVKPNGVAVDGAV